MAFDLRECVLTLVSKFHVIKVLFAELVQEKVASDMENFDTLLVISLNCGSAHKHMCYLTKCKSRVWINKLNPSGKQVNIPLCKVSMNEDKDINDD